MKIISLMKSDYYYNNCYIYPKNIKSNRDYYSFINFPQIVIPLSEFVVIYLKN